MRIVQKYGGTSLADAGRLRNAARRAVLLHAQGAEVLLVVSAQGDTTDRLVRQAAEVNPRAFKGRMGTSVDMACL